MITLFSAESALLVKRVGGVAEVPSLDYKKVPGGCWCSRLKASESPHFKRFLSLRVGLELASLEREGGREGEPDKEPDYTQNKRGGQRSGFGSVRFGSAGLQIMLSFPSAEPYAHLRD